MKCAAAGLSGKSRARRVLACAVAPVSVAALAVAPARGDVKAFSSNASDWLNAVNWTPPGVPNELDTALIIGGTTDMSLTGNLTIEALDFRGGQPRRLGNATTGPTDAILSLAGDSTGTGLYLRTPTTFTIEGTNIDKSGTGTGRLGLEITNSQQWSVSAGAALQVNADVSESGGAPRDLTFSGGGMLAMSGHSTISGALRVRGQDGSNLLLGKTDGDMASVSSVQIDSGTLTMDNSVAVNSNRVNDAAPIQMAGGQLQLVGGGSGTVTENLGQLQLNGSKGDYYVVSVSGNSDLRFASLQRSAGVMEINAGGASSLHFNTPPSGISDWQVGDWAIYNGTNWGKVDNTDGLVSAFTAYQTSTDPTTWASTDNVSATSSINVNSNTTVQSLKLSGGHFITITGTNFFATRGILAAGGGPVGDGITGTGSLTAKTGGDQSIKLFVTDTANNFTISVPITDNAAGAVDFIKAGAGTLLLDSTPTYTGTTYVANGMLKLGAQNGGVERSVVDINRDGILDVVGGARTIGGLSGSGSVLLGSTTLSVGANDSTTSFTGVISDDSGSGLGQGGITKVGAGTLVLAGTATNTYTGLTTVSAGTLELASIQRLGGDILIHGDATLKLDDGIVINPGRSVSLTHLNPTNTDRPGFSVDANAVATVNVGINEMVPDTVLHKTGGGTLVLGGINSYTGGTDVDGGTLQVTGKVRGRLVLLPGGFGEGSAFVLDPTNTPPVSDGQLDDDADVEFHGGTFSLVGTQAPGTIEVAGLMKAKEKANRTKCGSNLRMQFSGLQHDPGATMDFGLSAGAQVSFASPPALDNGIIGPWATAGSDWATLQPGTGQVTAYTAYNTNPDPTTWSAADNVKLTQNVTITNDTAVNTFVLDATKSHDDEVVKTFTWKGIMLVGAGSTTLHGAGTLTTPPGSSDFVIQAKDPFGNLRIDNAITDNGAPVSLVKDGEGTLELHGGNTYTGNTKVGRAVLKEFFQAGDKPSQSQFDVARGATFELGSPTGQIANLSGDGQVQLNSNTLTFGSNNASTSFGGEIVGAGGSIRKVGSGDFTLTAISTFSGDAFVEGGSLTLDGDGALANVRSVRVTRGGSIAMRASATDRQPPPRRISDAARITVAGGTVSLTAGAGPYTEDVGTLALRGGGKSSVKVTVPVGATTGTIRFTGSDFERRSAGTLDFAIDSGGSVQFTSPPALTNGILGPYATRATADWATVGSDGSVTAYSNYWAGSDPATWDATKNVVLSSSATVTANTTANTLKLAPAAGGAVVVTLQGQNFFATNGILATGNATITGTGSMHGASSNPMYVTVASGATLTANTATTDANGVATITIKSGGGTYTMNGATTYTGDTYVNEGTLQVAQFANLIDSYIHQTDDGITILGAGPRSLGGLDGGGTFQYNGTATLTIGGKGRDGEFSGSIQNVAGGALEFVGGGTLDLEGDSDLHGGELRLTNMRVRVNDLEARLQNIGLLRLGGGGNTGTIDITGDETALHTATALGDGNGRINKIRLAYAKTSPHLTVFATLDGSGNLVDSGGSTDYMAPLSHTGTTTFDNVDAALRGASGRITATSSITLQNAASLTIEPSATAPNSKINDAAPIYIDGGTMVFVNNGSTPATETLGTLNLRTYNTSLQYTIGDTVVHNSVIYQALVHSPGASLEVDVSPNNTISFATAPPLTNGILGEWATINGADWATIGGSGEVVPYTAYTTSSPLTWSPKSNVSLSADVTIPASTSINTLRLAPAAVPRAAQLAAGAALGTNGILAAGHDDSITGAGSLTAKSGGSKNIGIYVSDVSANFTVSVPITDNSEGSVGLIKSGDGMLTLAGHNTYTGPTAVRRGELKIKFQDGDIPTGSDFTVAPGATLNLDGNQVTLGKLSGGGSVNLGNGGGVLTLDQAADTTFAVLLGNGDVEKRGDGTLTLTGDSFFSGHATIAKGALVVDGGSMLNATDVTLNAGATLKIKEAQTAKEQLEKNPRNLVKPDLPITYASGGTLDVDLSAPVADKFQHRQEFGPVKAQRRGECIIQVDSGTDGGGVVLFDSFTRDDPNASFSFRYTGDSHICTAARHALTLSNGILGPAWTVNGADWATVDDSGEVRPYTGYGVNPDPPDWTPLDNVSMNIPAVLNGNVVVGTLKVNTVPLTLTGGSFFTTNGVLAAGGGSSSITGTGKIRGYADTGSLIFVADTGNYLTVSAPIVDPAGAGATCGLLKTGAGVLTLTGANTYSGDTIINAGTLEAASDQSLGSSSNKILLAGGTLKIVGVWASTNKPLRLAGSGTIDTNGHDIAIGDIDQDGPADFTKTGAGTLTLNTCACDHLRVAQGTVKTNVGVNETIPHTVLHVSRPAVDPGAQLDLTNNRLITQAPVGIITIIGSNYTGVTGMIQSGRNGGPAGTRWAGSGIVTSQSNAVTSNFTTLGVASASQVKGIAPDATTLWSGQTVTGSDTLVMYTYAGDATLDGKINVDDYGRIDFNVNLGTSGWYNGDFNYDGKINVDDYGIIDFNVGIQGASFATSGNASPPLALFAESAVSAVPEPVASLFALGLLLPRRRRRSKIEG